jgi:hypothetical protein
MSAKAKAISEVVIVSFDDPRSEHERVISEMLENSVVDSVVPCPHIQSTDDPFLYCIWVDRKNRILYQACDDCLTQLAALEGIHEA